MNHHIDMQIANARLLQLAQYSDRISAGELISDVVAAYPYRSTRETDCVEVIIHRDFKFRGSRVQFSGVLDNLIQNALHSLQASGSFPKPGDLRIEVGSRGTEGRITVSDRGIGIDAALLQRIFEPFFSSDHGTGHGLGLAFCRRVIVAAKGSIRVKSEPAKGAVFTITLPVDASASHNPDRGDPK
jgi:two-component system CAI-1 autoinducer sensor kinase/phosphatase CqsS